MQTQATAQIYNIPNVADDHAGLHKRAVYTVPTAFCYSSFDVAFWNKRAV